jgi:hypothetical protein
LILEQEELGQQISGLTFADFAASLPNKKLAGLKLAGTIENSNGNEGVRRRVCCAQSPGAPLFGEYNATFFLTKVLPSGPSHPVPSPKDMKWKYTVTPFSGGK